MLLTTKNDIWCAQPCNQEGHLRIEHMEEEQVNVLEQRCNICKVNSHYTQTCYFNQRDEGTQCGCCGGYEGCGT